MVHVRPKSQAHHSALPRGQARRAHQWQGSRGFVLPLTSGLGIAMLLVGMIMILRSQQSQIAASTQQNIAQSLAAAEAGIAHYQAFINQHREIATYCARDDQEHTQHSAYCNGHNWLSGTIPTLAACSVGEVQNFATLDAWKHLTAQHGLVSEYRLVRYTYAPVSPPTKNHLGTAELVVEGRTYPEDEIIYVDAAKTEVDSAKVTVTRLAVTIPIQGAQPTDIESQWEFADFQNASSCNSLPTPALPAQGLAWPESDVLDELPRLGNNANHPCINPGGSPTRKAELVRKLKEFCASLPPNFLPYRLTADDQLTPETLRLDGDNNVILYVQEDLAVDQPLSLAADSTLVVYVAKNSLTLAPGSMTVPETGRLIVYTQGNVHLTGNAPQENPASPDSANGDSDQNYEENGSRTDDLSALSAIANDGAVDNVQIYVYAPDQDLETSSANGQDKAPPPEVTLTNNPDLKLFIFAPQSAVTLENTQFTGTLWVHTLTQDEASSVTPSLIDLAQTHVFNRISRILSWQRQSSQ